MPETMEVYQQRAMSELDALLKKKPNPFAAMLEWLANHTDRKGAAVGFYKKVFHDVTTRFAAFDKRYGEGQWQVMTSPGYGYIKHHDNGAQHPVVYISYVLTPSNIDEAKLFDACFYLGNLGLPNSKHRVIGVDVKNTN